VLFAMFAVCVLALAGSRLLLLIGSPAPVRITDRERGLRGLLAAGAGLGAQRIWQLSDPLFASQEAGGQTLLIGVDFDAFFQAPQFAALWLTSVRKLYDVAVEEVVRLVVEDRFKGGGFFHGAVANESVDLAPFHSLDNLVTPALRLRLDELRGEIADGTTSVDPGDYPSA
jgi:hypothetical protein